MTVPYATTDSVLETTLILESDVDQYELKKMRAVRPSVVSEMK